MKTISIHPAASDVKYDRGRNAWAGTIQLQGMQTFISTFAAEDQEDFVPGRYTLYLEAESEADAPSPAAISLVKRLADNQQPLAKAIAAAMWADFSGTGPDSGMWWRGNLDDVVDEYDSGLPAIDSADAVLAWMRPEQIIVRNAGAAAEDEPIIEIIFAAPFEIEHSVGVLTDGANVLGIGYSLDVQPFEDS